MGLSQEAFCPLRSAHWKGGGERASGRRTLRGGVCISLVGDARKCASWGRRNRGIWVGGAGAQVFLKRARYDFCRPLHPCTCHLPDFELSLYFPDDQMGGNVALGSTAMRPPLSLWDLFPAELILEQAALNGK